MRNLIARGIADVAVVVADGAVAVVAAVDVDVGSKMQLRRRKISISESHSQLAFTIQMLVKLVSYQEKGLTNYQQLNNNSSATLTDGLSCNILRKILSVRILMVLKIVEEHGTLTTSVFLILQSPKKIKYPTAWQLSLIILLIIFYYKKFQLGS